MSSIRKLHYSDIIKYNQNTFFLILVLIDLLETSAYNNEN